VALVGAGQTNKAARRIGQCGIGLVALALNQARICCQLVPATTLSVAHVLRTGQTVITRVKLPMAFTGLALIIEGALITIVAFALCHRIVATFPALTDIHRTWYTIIRARGAVRGQGRLSGACGIANLTVSANGFAHEIALFADAAGAWNGRPVGLILPRIAVETCHRRIGHTGLDTDLLNDAPFTCCTAGHAAIKVLVTKPLATLRVEH
jgi:hypothetical protein